MEENVYIRKSIVIYNIKISMDNIFSEAENSIFIHDKIKS